MFIALPRLARPGPTLASLSSAGFVRRGLQEAGFNIRKKKTVGPKTQKLFGVIEKDIRIPAHALSLKNKSDPTTHKKPSGIASFA
ncbi:MnmC family methyltransferase [Enterobacter hormaechei]